MLLNFEVYSVQHSLYVKPDIGRNIIIYHAFHQYTFVFVFVYSVIHDTCTNHNWICMVIGKPPVVDQIHALLCAYKDCYLSQLSNRIPISPQQIYILQGPVDIVYLLAPEVLTGVMKCLRKIYTLIPLLSLFWRWMGREGGWILKSWLVELIFIAILCILFATLKQHITNHYTKQLALTKI